MRIGIDLDGVVLDFVTAFQDTYLEWFGRGFDGPWTDWESHIHETHFESNREAFGWFDRTDGWDRCRLVPGAYGGIDALLDADHTVVFVTARSGAGADAARRWHRTSPFAGVTDLHTNSPNKGAVRCSLHLDDSPHVIKDLKDQGRNVVRYKRPWNANVPFVKAVENWDEFVDHVNDAG